MRSLVYHVDPAATEVVGAMKAVPLVCVDLERVKEELTFKNPSFWEARSHGFQTTNIDPEIFLFRIGRDHVAVPRHYKVPYVAPPETSLDRRQCGADIEAIDHRITLRGPIQQEACAALLHDHNDKIISLACGRGKTVCTLFAASEGKRFPFLVVVNSTNLLRQWRNEIRKFYGVRDSDIGHVQRDVAEWEGKGIATAMLHTIVQRPLPREFYRYWRGIVFDEVHHLGSEMFSRACAMFPGERWGLSATVARDDKMDRVFRLHLGKVVYQNLQQPLRPKIYVVETKVRMDMSSFVTRGGRINFGLLYTAISSDDKRTQIVEDHLVRLAGRGRTILVLGERVQQLYALRERLRDRKVDAETHVGPMSGEDKEEALTHQVVLATQHIAREGLDRPAFDTLFVLIPFRSKGRVQQSLGRILRVLDGKKAPKVYVFVDDISVIRQLFANMERSIRKLGYEVEGVLK